VKVCEIKNLLKVVITLTPKNYTQFSLFTAELPVLYTAMRSRKCQETKFNVDPQVTINDNSGELC